MKGNMMKKLITMIMLIIIMLSGQTVRNSNTVSTTSAVTGEITTSYKTTSITITMVDETAPVAHVDAPCDEILTEPEAKFKAEETPAVNDQKAMCRSDQAVKAIEMTVTDMPETTTLSVIEIPEETSDSVTCVDDGGGELAPYTSADGYGTPNPLANPTPNEVTEINADDLIQPGD